MSNQVKEKDGVFYYTDVQGIEYVYSADSKGWVPATASNNGEKKQKYKTTKNKRFSEKPNRGVLTLIFYWMVKVLTFPIVAIGYLLEQFYGDDAPGKQALGAVAFVAGVLVGADNIWQLLGGSALFPWFETEWLGWNGWLWLWVRPIFWVSIVISMLIQVTQGRALRGKSPEQARQDLESNQYELPSLPAGTIDLTLAHWKDYKRSGMRQRQSVGCIAIAFWAFDSTF